MDAVWSEFADESSRFSRARDSRRGRGGGRGGAGQRDFPQGCGHQGSVPRATDGSPDWACVRAQFELDPNLMHFAGFFMTSHLTPVREADVG
jgi:hypothetical protein